MTEPKVRRVNQLTFSFRTGFGETKQSESIDHLLKSDCVDTSIVQLLNRRVSGCRAIYGHDSA